MSIDTRFARLTFPSIRDGGADATEAAARASGHAAGYLDGLRAASAEVAQIQERRDAEQALAAMRDRARVDAAVAALTAAARSLEERTVPVLADAQGTLAAASVDIAEAVLGHELSDGVRSARSALERALSSVDAAMVQVVRMNPADLADLGSAATATAVQFLADPSLERGDAVTEFDDGFLDARIGTAVARVRFALTVAS